MVGGHGRDKRRIADLECADAMTDGDRPHSGGVASDLGGHVGQYLGRSGMRRVLQPRHRAATVMVAHCADEADHRTGCPMCDERLVVGQDDGLRVEFGPEHDGAHGR